jgi:hypothetical protein
MATKTIPPMVLVTWEDATTRDDGTWVEHADKQEYKPQIMHTVGFLLYEGKEGVIVTDTWNEDQMSPRDQIPRGMIRKLTRLKG